MISIAFYILIIYSNMPEDFSSGMFEYIIKDN